VRKVTGAEVGWPVFGLPPWGKISAAGPRSSRSACSEMDAAVCRAELCYPFGRKHGRHRAVKRHEFITLFGGAAGWPLAARAQPATPVIGLLDQRSPDELDRSAAGISPARTVARSHSCRGTGRSIQCYVCTDYDERNWSSRPLHRIANPSPVMSTADSDVFTLGMWYSLPKFTYKATWRPT
jgi:hypothetical protein